VDLPGDASTVDLELRLTRAAPGADPARLLGEAAAFAAQSGQAVTEHGELDLGDALLAVGVLGEDVEDDRRAVDGRATEESLQVRLLGRRQFVVEHDGVAVERLGELGQFVDLAPTHVGGRVGGLAALDRSADDVGPGRVDE
jgi:hypothetical protein